MPGKDYSAISLAYAEQVVEGKIETCGLVRQACQRQLDDLQRLDWDYHFDVNRGNHVCWFIENLPHIKGRWKSRNIVLEPWQCFLLTTIFGWVGKETGFRRFRKVYIEIPRKNSKTTLAAGVALYLLCADGEPGPEVFSAAVTRDQAKLTWEIAQRMAMQEPEMRAHYGIEVGKHSITVPGKAGAFKPLSRDASSLEGLNAHGVVIDELHAHKTREVFDVLNKATGSRRQSMVFCITTAGDNRAGVCFEQHDYVSQILAGRHEDERYFGIIYTIDKEDDWTSEASIRKANPNYGVSALVDDLDSDSKQAQRSAQAQNTFLTKRLNVWVSTGTAYFNMMAWKNRCLEPGLKIEDFYGERCWISLDLASRTDIAVKLTLFRRDVNYYVFGKYYLPEAAVERGNPNYDIYAGWNRAGWLTLTPGPQIDFEFIEADLLEDRDKFQVASVPFDPFQATELSTRMLKEDLPMVELRATVQNYSEPMKALEAMVLKGSIRHNGDPVLDWMMGNVYGKVDAKDNVYPRKVRGENKIDGAVALITALNRALIDHGDEGSVYETRGLLSL
jgi:phage terminase large subunit-like protein